MSNQPSNSTEAKPKGILSVIGARNTTERRSQHAAWAQVLVEDRDGKRFTFDASAFHYDMKPDSAEFGAGDEQLVELESECRDYKEAIESALRWMSSYSKWNSCAGADALRAALAKHGAK